MSLEIHRKRIDEIDEKLTQLFLERMQVSADIAVYKKEKGLPIRDPEREREKLASVMEKASPEMQPYMRTLYLTLFELGSIAQLMTQIRPSDRVELMALKSPDALW